MSAPLETPSGAVLAALYLGRLQSALRTASQGCLQILGLRVVRECLIAALRQEGHAFTEQRFHEWFAGLKTLSDLPQHRLRPARAICQAILTELLHSSWPLLADAAEKIQRAFLALSDVPDAMTSPSPTAAHAEINAIIEEAHQLLAAIPVEAEDLPFNAISALLQAVGASTRFGQQERGYELLETGSGRIAREADTPTNCRWALDLLVGTRLASDWASPLGRLPLPIPLPGFLSFPGHGQCNQDPSDDDLWDTQRRLQQQSTDALRSALWQLEQWLWEAERRASTIAERSAGRRSTGRSGPVLEMLAGFGAMRGRQIELVLGASRLGVRTILATIAESGQLVTEAAHNRTMLYRYAECRPKAPGPQPNEESFAFSQQSLDEFEASMKALEALLDKASPPAGD
ncbi:hypothetical protein [Sphingomonas sp. IC081]|uniref:hypothetical protein n=1 Tax=Sphingomonas sp. IC081 TaxID=304378 RepID=UPI0011595AFA|nr:hypothetical protein [Sphingomonas sp. IC081]QDK34769.1 hypothetical protein DM450_18580 [Sphingomonas sp. IC081]